MPYFDRDTSLLPSPSDRKTGTRETFRRAFVDCSIARLLIGLHYWRFFARRIFVGVEQISGELYRRTVGIGTHQGWVSVENDPARSALRVEVSNSLLPVLMQILARLRRLFDLEATPQQIATHLGALAENHPGLRIPGAFDGFEMAVRAILGQQISVKAATTLAGRLTNQFGHPIVTPFPEPDTLDSNGSGDRRCYGG